jgi:hypothetical protein
MMTVMFYVLLGLVVGTLFGWGACEIRRGEREYWDAYHDGWNDYEYTVEMQRRWPMGNPDKGDDAG